MDLVPGGFVGWGAGLAAGAIVLAVVTWRTAGPGVTDVPDVAEYFARWRNTHDGYDPRHGSVWLRGWLLTVYRFARPLARAGVSPNVLTLWTVWAAIAVVAVAGSGGSWPAVAGWLVIFAGVGDSLDGAVAALSGRATRWGYVLDSAVDRVNDVLFAVALVVVGAPLWAALLYTVALFELEYIRARAGNAGGDRVGMITVGERANRIAFCAAGLFVAGLLPASAARVATATVAVLIGLSLVGVVQLTVAVRRNLIDGSGRPDEVGHDRGGEGDQRHSTTGM